MKVGDKIRLVRVPSGVKDEGEFATRAILARCVGCVFTIRGFQSDRCEMTTEQRSNEDWVELDIEEVMPGRSDAVWVEPGCIELVES